MVSAPFNAAACVADLERFNTDFASWGGDQFEDLARGNTILAGTANDYYQKFCRVYGEVEKLAETDPAARKAVEESRIIFDRAREQGLVLSTGPFAGPR